jgi:outer membrane protein assembly factor BamB
MNYARAALILLVLACPAAADDWPRWRGPRLNGISLEKDWLDQWPKDGPPEAWKGTVGLGFSSVIVAEGRAFTLGHKDEKDTIHCLDVATGKPIWQHSYDAALGDNSFDGGTTGTPTFHNGKLYTLSRWGDLFCFEAASGKVIWSRNLTKDDKARVPSWGFSGSPLVHENLLLLNVGKAGMALERDTGKVVWSSADEEPGYSTPVPFQRGGEWLLLVSSGTAFAAVKLKSGKPVWEHQWATRYGVNAADPILAGDQVFISSGYTKGCALLQMGDDAVKETWRNKNMRNQFNSCVLLDGFLYGIDGDTTGTPATLRCIELKSGEVRWTEKDIGSGGLTAAGGKLIVMTETGELIVAPASAKEFKPTARAKVLEGKCWTVPVLANGRIYCRNAAGDVVCLDVRKK